MARSCMGLYSSLRRWWTGWGFQSRFLERLLLKKWCPSVGFELWLLIADSHEEMQIEHRGCMFTNGIQPYAYYSTDVCFLFLLRGSEVWHPQKLRSPWSMKWYPDRPYMHSQGVNVGKYLKLMSSSWDKPTFPRMAELVCIEPDPARE